MQKNIRTLPGFIFTIKIHNMLNRHKSKLLLSLQYIYYANGKLLNLNNSAKQNVFNYLKPTFALLVPGTVQTILSKTRLNAFWPFSTKGQIPWVKILNCKRFQKLTLWHVTVFAFSTKDWILQTLKLKLSIVLVSRNVVSKKRALALIA